LFNDDEVPQPTPHPLIQRAEGPREPLPVWEAHLGDIEALVRNREVSALMQQFAAMVSNYSPPPLPPSLE